MTTMTQSSTNISTELGNLSVVLDDGSWSSTLTESASSAISSIEYNNGIMEVTFHRANSVSDSETYSFSATDSASTQMYQEISNVLSSLSGSVGTVYNQLVNSSDLTQLN
jgi:hypothetical protein